MTKKSSDSAKLQQTPRFKRLGLVEMAENATENGLIENSHDFEKASDPEALYLDKQARKDRASQVNVLHEQHRQKA